jgi:hypothetical protein
MISSASCSEEHRLTVHPARQLLIAAATAAMFAAPSGFDPSQIDTIQLFANISRGKALIWRAAAPDLRLASLEERRPSSGDSFCEAA